MTTPTSTPARLGYSPEEAAGIIGVSRKTIYNLLERQQLRSVKIGKRRVIPAAALAELMEHGTEPSGY